MTNMFSSCRIFLVTSLDFRPDYPGRIRSFCPLSINSTYCYLPRPGAGNGLERPAARIIRAVPCGRVPARGKRSRQP